MAERSFCALWGLLVEDLRPFFVLFFWSNEYFLSIFLQLDSRMATDGRCGPPHPSRWSLGAPRWPDGTPGAPGSRKKLISESCGRLTVKTAQYTESSGSIQVYVVFIVMVVLMVLMLMDGSDDFLRFFLLCSFWVVFEKNVPTASLDWRVISCWRVMWTGSSVR